MITEIVQRAIDHGVTDIGQLTRSELADLKRAVKQGVLQIVPS